MVDAEFECSHGAGVTIHDHDLVGQATAGEHDILPPTYFKHDEESWSSATVVAMPRYEITSREAAKALEARAEYLLPFAHRARTQREVADELGISLQVMHYWVAKFCKTGLLAVDRETPRAGRAVRHYRAIASSFFIPAALLTQETFRSEGRALVSAFVRDIEIVNPEIAFDAELRLDFPENSTIVQRDYARRGYHPKRTPDNAVLWTSAELNLTTEQGRELKRRAMALLAEFEALADANPPSAQPHRVFIATSPIPR